MYTCPPQKYRVILAHTGRPDLHQYFEGRLRAEFDISSFDHGPIDCALGVHLGLNAMSLCLMKV